MERFIDVETSYNETVEFQQIFLRLIRCRKGFYGFGKRSCFGEDSKRNYGALERIVDLERISIGRECLNLTKVGRRFK